MKRNIFFGIILLALIISFKTFVQGQSITGSIGSGTVTRGSSVTGSVVLNIPGGLHVNSNRPNSEYAIPTSVKVSGQGIRLGAVRYPRGKNRKFQFSENVINVYEGRVSFPFSVTVPAAFKGTAIRIRAVVRYQACTDEVCYPPKNKEVTLTARVR